MAAAIHHRLTEPLESVTLLFGGVLLIGFLLGTAGKVTTAGQLCASIPHLDEPFTASAAGSGFTARGGASARIAGSVQGCAQHASPAERALAALATYPGLLMWGVLLLMIWRLLKTVRQAGPYTGRVAAATRQLGWFIIGASIAVAAIQGYAQDQLFNHLITPGVGVGDAFVSPLLALPVPLLAGSALLTFARVIRRGVEMDAEIKATV